MLRNFRLISHDTQTLLSLALSCLHVAYKISKCSNGFCKTDDTHRCVYGVDTTMNLVGSPGYNSITQRWFELTDQSSFFMDTILVKKKPQKPKQTGDREK